MRIHVEIHIRKDLRKEDKEDRHTRVVRIDVRTFFFDELAFVGNARTVSHFARG